MRNVDYDKEIQRLEEVFSELKMMLHLSDEIIIRLNDKFFESIAVTLEKLREAINTQEYESIEMHAHSVKGSAASLRYTLISEIAQGLEKSAKAKENYPYEQELSKLSDEFTAAAHGYLLWKKHRDS